MQPTKSLQSCVKERGEFLIPVGNIGLLGTLIISISCVLLFGVTQCYSLLTRMSYFTN